MRGDFNQSHFELTHGPMILQLPKRIYEWEIEFIEALLRLQMRPVKREAIPDDPHDDEPLTWRD